MDKANLVNKICDFSMRDMGDHFREKDDLEALKISIRAIVDFYFFLEKNPRGLPNGEDVYDANMTIRSCSDYFFSFLDKLNFYDEGKSSVFKWERIENFSELRSEFLKKFALLKSDEKYSGFRARILLDLIKYQILFMGFTFDYELITVIQKTKVTFDPNDSSLIFENTATGSREVLKNTSPLKMMRRAKKLISKADRMLSRGKKRKI